MRKSSNDIPFKDLLRFSLPFKWSIISKYFDFDRDVGFFFRNSSRYSLNLNRKLLRINAEGLRGLGKGRDVFACGYQPCTIPCRNPLDNQVFAVISTNTDRLAFLDTVVFVDCWFYVIYLTCCLFAWFGGPRGISSFVSCRIFLDLDTMIWCVNMIL